MKVKDILAVKGTNVVTISEDATVWEALEEFAKNRVGSLIVNDRENEIVGIIGAKDVLMTVIREYGEIKVVRVKEIMTKDIIVADPEYDVKEVSALMTENRIRHVPVIRDKKLAGIVSIGDVVKAELERINVENRYLKDYISGKYPG